jgi:phospholipase C
LKYEQGAGPFPCSSDFPSSGSNYETLRDTLDAQKVSWRYYVPQFAKAQPGALWNAFDVISPVRYGSEWGTNVSWPEKNIFSDISGGKLPAMSWVIPDESNSDHPGYAADTGPSWVASVVNAIGQSSYWDTTAVIVVWDDWGGFYDPVAPPKLDDQGGPGFRVPMIVISPYTRFNSSSQPGYVSNTIYGFGSIIRFVEQTFNLPSLGTTDATSNSMSDMFNFNQTPRSFTTIPSKYSRAYFLHQKPSGSPVDTE